ncbi:MAG: adenosylmethionine--8-amino-7-oxononanoate transaminase, partial [Conexibacter sp.]|nr:adenosylmethionine--8-amino-7-oxononanoate transaminase [Conexibacter sp.]
MDWDALIAADRRHVWHPYGPMPGTVDALPVVGAQG